MGEGRRIVFVEPERVATLDLAESTALFVPRFLTSSTYSRLSDLEPPGVRPVEG